MVIFLFCHFASIVYKKKHGSLLFFVLHKRGYNTKYNLIVS